MKNKGIIVSLFLISFSFNSFAETKLTGFSFSPEIGFLNGKIIENVWRANMTYTNSSISYSPTTKESRLDWNIDNRLFYGFNINAAFNDKILLELNFKNALSGTCGEMEDFDWRNGADPDHLTDYSIHTNVLENLSQVNFNIGYIFYLNKNHSISMTPKVGLESQRIAFSGKNGWGIYESKGWAITSYEGKTVITYEQSYLAPLLKLSTNFLFLNNFEANIDLSAVIIPKMECLDFHYRSDRLYIYNDKIQNAWKFKGKLALHWRINSFNKIGLQSSITLMPDTYGFTYIDNSTNPSPSSLGGTSRFLWTYGFVYTFYF